MTDVSEIYEALLEAFGEPIGKTKATVGAADQGSRGKALWNDEPKKDRPWSDPTVIDESSCDQCGKMSETLDETPNAGSSVLDILRAWLDRHNGDVLVKGVGPAVTDEDLQEYARMIEELKGNPDSWNAAWIGEILSDADVRRPLASEVALQIYRSFAQEEAKMPQSIEEAVQKSKKKPATEKWKKERLKGCKCSTANRTNKNCPIHGTKKESLVREMHPDDFNNYDRTGSEDMQHKMTTPEDIAAVVNAWYQRHGGKIDLPATGNRSTAQDVIDTCVTGIIENGYGSMWQIEGMLQDDFKFSAELAGELYKLISDPDRM